MTENMVSAILGVVCILIGISQRKGNLSLLHSYHRKNVSEADRIPFGKLVGLGTILIGIALIAMGALSYAAAALQNSLYTTIANITLAVGLVIGLGISFYAMLKYNKGIF